MSDKTIQASQCYLMTFSKEDQGYKPQALPEHWQPSDLLSHKDHPVWIHIDGLGSTDMIIQIAQYVEIHPLIIEDILTPLQRPKTEDYGEILFIVLREFALQKNRHIKSKQISIVLGKYFLITLQEKAGEPFNTVLNVLNGFHKTEPSALDQIVYFFIDAIVDHMAVVLDKIGPQIEKLEDAFMQKPDKAQIKTVHGFKRETTRIRRFIWPLHEAVRMLRRCDSPLLQKTTQTYLRDVEDHLSRSAEIIEGYRDSVSEMQELYMSASRDHLNEIMKVLTIISTTFIPLNFLAAVYGMNFKYMPELDLPLGYLLFWVIIAIIGGSMLYSFKKRGWLANSDNDSETEDDAYPLIKGKTESAEKNRD